MYSKLKCISILCLSASHPYKFSYHNIQIWFLFNVFMSLMLISVPSFPSKIKYEWFITPFHVGIINIPVILYISGFPLSCFPKFSDMHFPLVIYLSFFLFSEVIHTNSHFLSFTGRKKTAHWQRHRQHRLPRRQRGWHGQLLAFLLEVSIHTYPFLGILRGTMGKRGREEWSSGCHKPWSLRS